MNRHHPAGILQRSARDAERQRLWAECDELACALDQLEKAIPEKTYVKPSGEKFTIYLPFQVFMPSSLHGLLAFHSSMES